jgi:hypothetical protein
VSANVSQQKSGCSEITDYQVAATQADILEFVRGHSFGVQASVSPSVTPQAAVVGFIVSDTFELFFDTVESTRKVTNLRHNSAIDLVSIK